jgi:hypothetical protein
MPQTTLQYPRTSMRLSLAFVCLLVMVGCVGPHSTGALWAQQNVENELVNGRLTDAERAARMHGYELALADEALGAERARIGLALQDCPGAARQTLEISMGDRVRDAIRMRIGDDPQRQAAVAQVALADWRLRRAQATGEAHFCVEARQALSDTSTGESNAADLLPGLGPATVAHDPRHTGLAADQTPLTVSLSNYALGYTDMVRARAPLPQYLAAVYGGVVLDVSGPPALNGETPEGIVDRLAPAHPEWEPDAIYAALRPT